MEVHGFLPQLMLFTTAALICVPLTKITRLGSVIGYLVAGILIGPYAFGFISEAESILHFAELGVVLLLFVIGLEMQPEKLRQLRKLVFGLGTLQLVGTAFLLFLISKFAFDQGSNVSIVIGLALGLSSTAFVLQLLKERGENGTNFGRGAFGVLIFQDLAVIPILAIIPLLGAGEGQSTDSMLVDFAKSALVIISVILVGKLSLRHICRWISSTGMQELMTAAALLLVIGVAELMLMVKLSMGLGAFLAGLLLADSEFRHEFEANVEPFKGLLLGLFFIAVGMRLDLSLLMREPGSIAGLVIGLIALKTLMIYPLARSFQFTKTGSWKLSLILAQGGEFAFVIFNLAVKNSVVPSPLAKTLNLVVTLSMVLSPIVYILASRLVEKRFNKVADEPEFDTVEESNPVIIAGFGRFGQIVGRVLRMKGIGFTALEHDPAHVNVVRKFGNKIYYGDASRVDLLHAAGAEEATLFVLAIDNVESSIHTAEIVRTHFPKLKIVARARNREHYFRLKELGIENIIRETFYSGLEAARISLKHLGDSPTSASIAVNYFRDSDLQLIEEQFEHFHDQDAMIAKSKRASQQLSEAFTKDTSPT